MRLYLSCMKAFICAAWLPGCAALATARDAGCYLMCAAAVAAATAAEKASAAVAPQRALVQQGRAMSWLTLRFADPYMENQFTAWHYSCLAKVWDRGWGTLRQRQGVVA